MLKYLLPLSIMATCLSMFGLSSSTVRALETQQESTMQGTDVETHPGQTCIDPNCNGDDGCAWVSGIETFWYPQTRCASSGSTGGSPCPDSDRLCRINKHYWVHPPCSVLATTVYDYRRACSGVGPLKNPVSTSPTGPE